jgi:hypothetical protein
MRDAPMYLNCAHEVQAADTLVVRCLHLVSAVLACPAYRPGRKPRSDADADARAGVRPLATAEQVPREGEGGGGVAVVCLRVGHAIALAGWAARKGPLRRAESYVQTGCRVCTWSAYRGRRRVPRTVKLQEVQEPCIRAVCKSRGVWRRQAARAIFCLSVNCLAPAASKRASRARNVGGEVEGKVKRRGVTTLPANEREAEESVKLRRV